MKLTQRQQEVLRELEEYATYDRSRVFTGWARPLDIGGSDASHHSGTLGRLVDLGLVEKRARGGHPGCVAPRSFLYRITDAGRQALRGPS